MPQLYQLLIQRLLHLSLLGVGSSFCQLHQSLASLLSAATVLNVFQEVHINVCFAGEGFHLGCILFGGQHRFCFRVLQDILQLAEDADQTVSSAGAALEEVFIS